jgi:hypothetical protein
MTAWWYDPKHYWGVRHIAFWIAVAVVGLLLVTTHIVGLKLCAQRFGCVYSQDGSVNAAPTTDAPAVVRP